MSAEENRFDYKAYLKTLSTRPGVYRMLDANEKILYVGKADNLKARVSSYFRRDALPVRIQAMVAQIADIQITITNTTVEALLLESNLIKELKPKYNIYLRDDKSYPYIYVSTDSTFPRLAFDRGKQHGNGRYFGPYPSASAVRETLGLLQKLFQVRQCEDSFFRNRSRPCLQYQIKRCSAPCVGLVSEGSYQQDVEKSLLFLNGKNTEVIDVLAGQMEKASAELNYEAAATYRDQIQYLRKIYDKQYISGEGGDLDIIASVIEDRVACVQVFYVRGGRVLGNKAFFPSVPENAANKDVLHAFISQYYARHEIIAELLVNEPIEDQQMLADILSTRTEINVSISGKVRGERAKWLRLAEANAKAALNTYLSSRQGLLQKFESLKNLLELDTIPERIECFDVSHTRGEATVAACVVFDQQGPVKSDYRRFNIKGVTPGDDYAAMRQALERRYTRLKKGESKMSDVLLIDGGKGQVAEAMSVMEELQIQELAIVGVAKGPERIAGRERLVVPHLNKTLVTAADTPGLHLIQNIRDEAHRFAITGHRARRSKARNRSVLEDIEGLGPKRRQALLQQFGGLQGLKKAGIEDLAGVQGISDKMAQKIYLTLHES